MKRIKNRMQLNLSIVALSVSFFSAPLAANDAEDLIRKYSNTFALPNKAARVAIFDKLQKEIERLDGATLMVRSTREETWTQTMKNLRVEAASAETPADFVTVLRRIDNTYPNLHSNLELGEGLSAALPEGIRPSVGLFAEVLSSGKTELRISRVDSDLQISEPMLPNVGDKVVAISGRPVAVWLRENYTFCKFALRAQCDQNFTGSFFKEILSWKRSDPLSYTLERAGKYWTVSIPVHLWRSSSNRRTLQCALETNRYEGFSLTYTGNRACVYTSSVRSDTALLRITRFRYGSDDKSLIKSVSDEVSTLLPWWQEHAHWKNLIIDLIDNGGGNEPIDYYKMLLEKPFQELYVRLRKAPELENEEFRSSLFWTSKEHEIWFQKLNATGVYNSLKPGEFLPPVPQFCANKNLDCAGGKFTPYEHPFRGRVTILVNQYCVSSCDGFVWQLADKLRGRVRLVGQPPAGDPAWTRLAIDVIPDPSQPGFFTTALRPVRANPPPDRLFSQTVNVSLDTDARGNRVDGIPFSVDTFVPVTLENRDNWPNAALKAALDAR